MAKDPGGFLSFLPCFYFCCLRRRPENLAANSEAKLGSDASSSQDGEDDKINYDQSGYGAIEEQESDLAVVDEPKPSWNDVAERYSNIASQHGESSEGEEEGEAFTKPLESLSVARLKEEDVLSELDTNLASESVVSSTGSTGEAHDALGDTETYSLSGKSATITSVKSYSSSHERMSPALLRRVDTSSVDSWSTSSKRGGNPSLMLRADTGSVDSWPSRKGNVTSSIRSMQEDTASMKSWTSRTEKTLSLRSLQAESSSVKSWSKGETASLDRQHEIVSDPESSASLEDITEKSVENITSDKSFSYDDLKSIPELDAAPAAEDPVYSVPQKKQSSEPAIAQPVPEIEIDSSNLAKESLRSKNSDDSGVVVDKFKSLPPHYTSQSAMFSDLDEIEPAGMRNSASMASLDSAGSTKKKKKIKLFKNFHFKKKKKKNKLAAQREQGVSLSTPSLAHHSDQSNLSIRSRFSASVLLASLDDMSDDDICRE